MGRNLVTNDEQALLNCLEATLSPKCLDGFLDRFQLAVFLSVNFQGFQKLYKIVGKFGAGRHEFLKWLIILELRSNLGFVEYADILADLLELDILLQTSVCAVV